MVHSNQEKYFFFFLLAVVLAITFLIFRPFLIVIILAISFSVAVHPLHAWFLKRVTASKALAAFLTTISFISIVGAPLVGIGLLVYEQSHSLFLVGNNSSLVSPIVNTVSGLAESILPEGFTFEAEEMAQNFVGTISKNLANIFASTLSTILSIFLMILSIFFFLKDGEVWKKFLVGISPMSDLYDSIILKELRSTISGVVKGYLLVALVQGILLGIGLTIFGVSNAALWGLAGGISALVPTVGTAIVAVPIIIFLYATGDTAGAIGFLVWSTLIVGLVDNLLHPIVTARKVALPPLAILFSVLGGIALFGPAGILVGPLCVSLLHTLLSLYRKHFRGELVQD